MSNMHVIQSQLVNYSYDERVQKEIKLVRWWVVSSKNGEAEIAISFTEEQQQIFLQFMNDHLENFPVHSREIFDTDNLKPPLLVFDDQESDTEKPCILLIRSRAQNTIAGICRRMDIILQNDQLAIQLPFDLAGEIILEKA